MDWATYFIEGAQVLGDQIALLCIYEQSAIVVVGDVAHDGGFLRHGQETTLHGGDGDTGSVMNVNDGADVGTRGVDGRVKNEASSLIGINQRKRHN